MIYVFIITFLVICFLFSIWRGYVLFSLISRLERAKKWKSISATIEDSRVTNVAYRRMDGKLTRHHLFAYFIIDGVRYGCFRPSLYSEDKKFIGRVLGRTKVGSVCDIFYDPENPSDNVLLDPSRHGYLLNIILFMSSFLFFFLVTVFYLIGQ